MAIPVIGTTPSRTAQADGVTGALIRNRDIELVEDFNLIPGKASMFPAFSPKSSRRTPNPNWLISGKNLSGGGGGGFNSSNGAQHDISGTGALVLGASSKSSNRIFLKPRLTGAVNLGISRWQRITWPTSASPYFETTIRTFTSAKSLDHTIIQAGLLLTHIFDLTTDADQIKFWCASSTSVGKLYVAVSIANVDTLTDTGITLAINTNYKLQIAIDSDRTAQCFVNGDRVPCFLDAQSMPLFKTTALTSLSTFIPHIGFRTQTNNVGRPKLGVYNCKMGRNYA